MTILAGLVGKWLTPMFEERPDQRLYEAIILAVLIAGYAAALLMLRRIVDPGPLARGEARWRYRSRAFRERIARTRTWLVLFDRKPGWWATRIEFVAAIACFTMVAVALVASPATVGRHDGDALPLWWLLAPGVGIAGMLIGLAWMIRLYRAPLDLDSKAYWRYRDGA